MRKRHGGRRWRKLKGGYGGVSPHTGRAEANHQGVVRWPQRGGFQDHFRSCPRPWLSHATIRSVTIPRDLLVISLVLIAAFGSACGVAGPSACTVIGCTGLVVEVTGAPGSTAVTVVVIAPDGSTRSTTCTSASGACPVSFPDFTPATVTIRVSTGNQTTEVTKQPTYEVTRPNGPACPPECRNARVTVVL